MFDKVVEREKLPRFKAERNECSMAEFGFSPFSRFLDTLWIFFQFHFQNLTRQIFGFKANAISGFAPFMVAFCLLDRMLAFVHNNL